MYPIFVCMPACIRYIIMLCSLVSYDEYSCELVSREQFCSGLIGEDIYIYILSGRTAGWLVQRLT